jgi:hypothetical protein
MRPTTENMRLPPASIFHKKEPTNILFSMQNEGNTSHLDISYDGLGGHSKLDTFPKPNNRPPIKGCIPKLTSKHKLKRPNPPAGNQDISKLLGKLNNK